MAPSWAISLSPHTAISMTLLAGPGTRLASAMPSWLYLTPPQGNAWPHTMNLRERKKSMQSRSALRDCT